MRRIILAGTTASAMAIAFTVATSLPQAQAAALRFSVTLPSGPGLIDGRLLVMIAKDPAAGEPRFQINDGVSGQLIFGMDVDGATPGSTVTLDGSAIGFPLASINDIPAGTYSVQALVHKYETFKRADGHTVKLPMDRGEGQQWARAPGNPYSTPQTIAIDPKASGSIAIRLDQVIAPLPTPADTKYVKHERILSERLSRFWGRPMHLGAHVLLPEGWDTHPEAKYPLFIYHGHFPADLSNWRDTPPDPNLKPDFSARFNMSGYNRVQQEFAWQFYKDWTSPNFPRAIVIEIQHANPFYDDSYAVNSANIGPYGDAIIEELLPFIEKKYRGLGQGWSRFMYGGSTGGWEAMAAQVKYPDAFNGAYIACPDPIDFRAFTVVDLYKDNNAYWLDDTWKKTPRPGRRNYLGHVSATLQELNQLELVLGTKTRSGQQWDVWEAVYSPVGPDGYPARIWDRQTGVIDKTVAEYWRDNYDLMHILRRDWNKGLGKKLEGKLNIYVGDMDNYYLNNAVYLAEEFLESTKDPYYDGEVLYGDRAEHCWNGDATRPNALSRLRYHQMYIPKGVERMLKTAPAGADLKSWRY
ncbi:MAG TPA: alpha/beta hydrolase-fold protein [Vicinamibacterales bacterium]|nr:alpha/beta hydrolase-fold protein [Vicinamibacterales bacterium]